MAIYILKATEKDPQIQDDKVYRVFDKESKNGQPRYIIGAAVTSDPDRHSLVKWGFMHAVREGRGAVAEFLGTKDGVMEIIKADHRAGLPSQFDIIAQL